MFICSIVSKGNFFLKYSILHVFLIISYLNFLIFVHLSAKSVTTWHQPKRKKVKNGLH